MSTLAFVAYRVRFQAFLLGFRLMRWGLKHPSIDREVGRLVRYHDIVGNLEGFVPHERLS